jgi:hypothetical protein
MTNKLYVVEVSYKAYVWAENDTDAVDMADEIVKTEEHPIIIIQEATRNTLGWKEHFLVYHSGDEEISLELVAPWNNKGEY